MSEELFSKKSLEKIKSPESLNDYIRVANPGIWLLFVGIILILAGACIWGFYGRIESSADVTITVADGVATCTVLGADTDRIKPGMILRADNVTGSVTEVVSSRGRTSVSGEIRLPDGKYEAKIVMESVKPFSFVLN